MSTLKYKQLKRQILFIDGLSFDKPNTLSDYLYIGWCGFWILITFPVWIWFYLFGKAFTTIAKSRYDNIRGYQCPNCKNFITDVEMGSGDLWLIQCECGWKGYVDNFDKLVEIKGNAHKKT